MLPCQEGKVWRLDADERKHFFYSIIIQGTMQGVEGTISKNIFIVYTLSGCFAQYKKYLVLVKKF